MKLGICEICVNEKIEVHQFLLVGIQAFTDAAHAWLKFAAEHGLDAISQSFVETAEDVEAVRSAASHLGYFPLLVTKIERSRALEHVMEFLDLKKE